MIPAVIGSAAPVATPPPIPAKAPPPFPVVATAKGEKAPPPVPPAPAAAKPAAEAETHEAATKPAGKKRTAVLAGGVVVALLAGIGGYLGVKKFLAPPPPPPAKKTTPAPVAKAPPATAPKAGAPQAQPSEALSKIAKAPGEAINKAQDAIAAKRASNQNRVDGAAEGQDVADKAATPAAADPSKSGPPKTSASKAVTTVAPGVTATTTVDAAVDASPAFKSFVSNAKISGVVWSAKPMAFINGRLARVGDVVEPTIGVTFEGVDLEKRVVIFKDKSGAIVVRRQ